MAVTYVASTAGTTTATLPAGTTSGDLVVVFAQSSSGTTPTLPASWTNITSNATLPATRVQSRVYDGVWTMPTFTNAAQCHAITVRGQDTVNPVGVTSITAGSTTNPVMPTVTLQDNSGNSQLLRNLNHTRPDSVITAPANHTSRQASGTQPGWITMTKNSTTDGLTCTFTISRGTTWTQSQVEIRQPFTTQAAAVAMTTTSTLTATATQVSGALALIETLVEPFNSLSAQWSVWDARTSIVAGQLQMAPLLASTVYTGIQRTDRHILRGSHISVECVSAGNMSMNSWEAYPLILLNDAGAAKMQFFISVGSISAYLETFGSFGTVPYNSTNHRFLQIRESGGTYWFEVSANGTTWNTLYSGTIFPPSFDVDKVWVMASAGTWANNEGQATTMVIDNINVVPAVTAQPTRNIHNSNYAAIRSSNW